MNDRIQGISDEFIPSIVDLEYLDDIVAVADGDAILMAQKLAFSLGLGVGISSGANLPGALAVQNQLGKDSVVVTMLPDSNKKYLTPDVQLLGFHAFKRVCQTCCDQDDCEEIIAGGCRVPACLRRVRDPGRHIGLDRSLSQRERPAGFPAYKCVIVQSSPFVGG